MHNSAVLILFLLLTACTSPYVQKASDSIQLAELNTTYSVMKDGYQLPFTVWESDAGAEVIILALHGFNDYRYAFSEPASFFAANRITTYAYDQRGFGETAQRGLWPDTGILESDAAEVANLLCNRHPDLPLFLLGESMGAAVIMTMQKTAPCIKGMILSAPAVWGWQSMPLWQRYMLQIATHVAPDRTLTGEWLDIKPSDNNEMLLALGRDPLVIKETRIDAIYGLTNLMQAASIASSEPEKPGLILYGWKDEIITRKPFCKMLQQLPETADLHLVLYPEGYHMLMRDLQSNLVLQDILSWIKNQAAALPSGHQIIIASEQMKMFCQ